MKKVYRNKFRIVRTEEDGIYPYYDVQAERKFLWLKWWKPVRGMRRSTIEEAEELVERKLYGPKEETIKLDTATPTELEATYQSFKENTTPTIKEHIQQNKEKLTAIKKKKKKKKKKGK